MNKVIVHILDLASGRSDLETSVLLEFLSADGWQDIVQGKIGVPAVTVRKYTVSSKALVHKNFQAQKLTILRNFTQDAEWKPAVTRISLTVETKLRFRKHTLGST